MSSQRRFPASVPGLGNAARMPGASGVTSSSSSSPPSVLFPNATFQTNLTRETVTYQAQQHRRASNNNNTSVLQKVTDTSKIEPNDSCSICLCELLEIPDSNNSSNSNNNDDDNNSNDSKDYLVSLPKCNHIFHVGCIRDALSHGCANCPTCRKPIDKPQGTSPSGTMTINVNKLITSLGPNGCIEITYDIPSSRGFSGTFREAYLPNTIDGQVTLRRLKFAFLHGLTFRVGTSLTTGQSNVVTWASIHHKTSLHGGAYGYPDPNYIQNVNSELDQLGVPLCDNSNNNNNNNGGGQFDHDEEEEEDDDDYEDDDDDDDNNSGVYHGNISAHSPAASSTTTTTNNDPNLVQVLQYNAPRNQQELNNRGSGPCPSGKMSIYVRSDMHLSGFPNDDTIEIEYDIPDGTQANYHYNPGVRFSGTRRVAYLPDTFDGQYLLERLKIAFMCGHLFDIGTSQTTRQQNTIVWGSIPQKSTTAPNHPFGYPDPSYFTTCHAAMDLIGIPRTTGGGGGGNTNRTSNNTHNNNNNTSTATDTDDEMSVQHDEIVCYVAPDHIAIEDISSVLEHLDGNEMIDSNNRECCLLCNDTLCNDRPVRLTKCNCQFHYECIEPILLQESTQCPSCNIYLEPRGKGPSGTMSISTTSSIHLPRTNTTSTIVIEYNVPDGIQKHYHENPNTPYTGFGNRTTYLPNNRQGQELLQRLQLAFTSGLTFCIGTSATTGESNVVKWSTHIPQKTAAAGGGEFGYPDPRYITKCHDALDKIGLAR